MPALDFHGDYGADVRPARAGSGRKAWAKNPGAPGASDGTRLDATFVNDLVAMLRATFEAYSVVAAPGDDTALTTAIDNAIAAGLDGSGFAPLASPALTGVPTAPTAAPGTNTTQLATTAFVTAINTILTNAIDSLIATKAPLASPSLTGVPTAPTASAGTNTTQLATTAFVRGEVSALVAAAPGLLDTLDEIAAALGDDQNFATTMTAALAAKAPLASPTFTGNPLAPTPAATDNGTSIATTAFVRALVSMVGIVPAAWFGTIGTADDTAVVQSAINALQPGQTLDLGTARLNISGTLTCTTSHVGIRGRINLVGGTSQLGLHFYGASQAVPYGGSAIAANATSITVTSAAGVVAGDLIQIGSTDQLTAATYLKGETVEVRSVSGNVLTLSEGTRLSYVSGITLTRVRPVVGTRIDLDITGDPAKQQRGILLDGCVKSFGRTVGENVGHYTIGMIGCVDCAVEHDGANPGITSDNGLDYGVVHADGCRRIHIVARGREYRHVVAGGNTVRVDVDVTVVAVGGGCKDSVVDCHPGVVDYTCDVTQGATRAGGTFSNQPTGLMFQGGGYLKARVRGASTDTALVTLQPLQNTIDHLEVAAMCRAPTSAATRIVEVLIQKPGGTVSRLDVKAEGALTNASGRGVNVDTSGSASGVTVERVEVRDSAVSAPEYGVLVYARNGHTIRSVDVSRNAITGVPNTGRGVLVGAAAGGTIGDVMSFANHISSASGATTARGIQMDNLGAGTHLSLANRFAGFASGNDITPAPTSTGPNHRT